MGNGHGRQHPTLKNRGGLDASSGDKLIEPIDRCLRWRSISHGAQHSMVWRGKLRLGCMEREIQRFVDPQDESVRWRDREPVVDTGGLRRSAEALRNRAGEQTSSGLRASDGEHQGSSDDFVVSDAYDNACRSALEVGDGMAEG